MDTSAIDNLLGQLRAAAATGKAPAPAPAPAPPGTDLAAVVKS